MNLFEKMIHKMCPEMSDREKRLSEQIKHLEEQIRNQEKYLKQISHILDNTVKIRTELHNTCQDVKKVRVELHDTSQDTKKVRVELHDVSQDAKKVRVELHDTHVEMKQKYKETLKQNNDNKRRSDEILWAEIFNNTIYGSSWLEDKTFSLGRWAIGYPCAYVLYRVLNELNPKNILELGLGQSTRLTGQYAEHYDVEKHLVVEHDPEWINFFSRNYTLPEVTQIVHCPWKYGEYKGVEGIREFDGFRESVGNNQFDLIVIDAPFGGDMKTFARIDVLKMLPGCLSKSFVVIFDDCNRSGENHTYNEMLQVLDDSSVEYKTGIYQGDKTIKIICSPDYSFVTSM